MMFDPDWLTTTLCEKCQRHSISPEAKKQCKFLLECFINDDQKNVFIKGNIITCLKFKGKQKQKKKGFGRMQKEQLF